MSWHNSKSSCKNGIRSTRASAWRFLTRLLTCTIKTTLRNSLSSCTTSVRLSATSGSGETRSSLTHTTYYISGYVLCLKSEKYSLRLFRKVRHQCRNNRRRKSSDRDREGGARICGRCVNGIHQQS